MSAFKKGDIIVGEKNARAQAYHRVVFISGPDNAPFTVVLTHSNSHKYPCNMKLSGIYDSTNNRDQYFVAHLIEKLPEWGSYSKNGELNKEDLELVETHISSLTPVTWSEYKEYTKNGCPDHEGTNAREGSK